MAYFLTTSTVAMTSIRRPTPVDHRRSGRGAADCGPRRNSQRRGVDGLESGGSRTASLSGERRRGWHRSLRSDGRRSRRRARGQRVGDGQASLWRCDPGAGRDGWEGSPEEGLEARPVPTGKRPTRGRDEIPEVDCSLIPAQDILPGSVWRRAFYPARFVRLANPAKNRGLSSAAELDKELGSKRAGG
jgi:hypothetical protein